MMFEQFIGEMNCAGCEVTRGKYLSFKLPGAARFIRAKSLGDDYTEEALRERYAGKRTSGNKEKVDSDAEHKSAEYMIAISKQKTPSLLIDIQSKIRDGAGAGYVQCMSIFNLKPPQELSFI